MIAFSMVASATGRAEPQLQPEPAHGGQPQHFEAANLDPAEVELMARTDSFEEVG